MSFYLFCFYSSDYPTGRQFLFDVLDLGHICEMSDAVDYVTAALDKELGYNEPALKLQLARKYKIARWVEPTARILLRLDTSLITWECANQIGHDVYFVLASTKAKIEEMRKRMAFKAPYLIEGADCKNHALCQEVWNRIWWDCMGPLILRPDWLLAGPKVQESLENKPIPGVNRRCQDETVESLANKGTFLQDTEVLEEGIRQIRVICDDTTPMH